MLLCTGSILKTVMESSSCMMRRCLAQPCPLSFYVLPAHSVVCGLCPLVITFEVFRVELYDAAVSWHSRARSLSTHCLHTLWCTCVVLPDTAVSAPFSGCGFECTVRRYLARQCPLSRRLMRVYAATHWLHTPVCSWIEGRYGGTCALPGCCSSWQCSLPRS